MTPMSKYSMTVGRENNNNNNTLLQISRTTRHSLGLYFDFDVKVTRIRTRLEISIRCTNGIVFNLR